MLIPLTVPRSALRYEVAISQAYTNAHTMRRRAGGGGGVPVTWQRTRLAAREAAIGQRTSATCATPAILPSLCRRAWASACVYAQPFGLRVRGHSSRTRQRAKAALGHRLRQQRMYVQPTPVLDSSPCRDIVTAMGQGRSHQPGPAHTRQRGTALLPYLPVLLRLLPACAHDEQRSQRQR